MKHALMCKPLHFSVEYVINPWMQPGTVDKENAMVQWQNLVNILQSLGSTVDIIDQVPGVPDMVFSTDEGIVRGNDIILSNFHYKERQPEREFYCSWYKEHNFNLHYLPSDFSFEGGEALWWNNVLFVGTGFRTNKEICPEISKILNITVLPLELVNPAFYHLDTCLFPLNEDIIFYYPPAFSTVSKNILKKMVPYLIPFSREEAFSFCANSIVMKDTVVTSADSASFQARLARHGYNMAYVNVGEFLKSGGGVHCLVQKIS